MDESVACNTSNCDRNVECHNLVGSNDDATSHDIDVPEAKPETSQNGNDVEEGEVVEVEDGEIVEDSSSSPEPSVLGNNGRIDYIIVSHNDVINRPYCNYFRRLDFPYQQLRQNSRGATNTEESCRRYSQNTKQMANTSLDVGFEFESKRSNVISYAQETNRKPSTESTLECSRDNRANDIDGYGNSSRRRNTVSPNRNFRNLHSSQDATVDDVSYSMSNYRSRESRRSNWERRDRWNKEERGPRERSRPLPYTRTLQDSMEWRDPWQRSASPGRRKRSAPINDDEHSDTKRRHRYSRSRSSSASSSSSSHYRRRHGHTSSKSWNSKRSRKRSVSRRLTAHSFSSDGSREVTRRSPLAHRSSSGSYEAREKDSQENPRDFVRTIFARKKNKKNSGSMRSGTSASNSISHQSEVLGELTTEDEVVVDVEEKDGEELLDIESLNREELKRQLKVVEAAIRKRRAKQQMRTTAAGDA